MELREERFLTTRDGNNLRVRRLRNTDADALVQFSRDLSENSCRLFHPHRYDHKTVANVLQRSEAGEDLVLGLFDDERLVGYFFLWYFKEQAPLLGIGLLDEFQGHGLGKKMLNLLIEEAGKNGNEGIELTTMQDNNTAFELYKKMGFRYYKDMNSVTDDGRVVVGERAMFREIKPGAQPLGKERRPPWIQD